MHFQWIQQLDWSLQISESISNCPSPDASTSDLIIRTCDEVFYLGQSPKSPRLVGFLYDYDVANVNRISRLLVGCMSMRISKFQ